MRTGSLTVRDTFFVDDLPMPELQLDLLDVPLPRLENAPPQAPEARDSFFGIDELPDYNPLLD
jgi:hypothetical protein